MSKMGDKVLAGLYICRNWEEPKDCEVCPYWDMIGSPDIPRKCMHALMDDAAAIIDVYEQFARSMAEGGDLR